ncbi:MAG TPA: OmpA family protein [Methylocella sp.]|nr:OmpA family protein [Methylocella sp.]
MAIFDGLIEELSARFNLGPKASALVEEVLGLIDAEPAGLDGFAGRFWAPGRGTGSAAWRMGAETAPLSADAVQKALGAGTVCRLAGALGVTQEFAASALGYAIPQIIRLLSQENAALEPSLTARVQQVKASVIPGSKEQTPRVAFEARYIVPGAAFVITLGLFAYAISAGTAGDRGPVQLALRPALEIGHQGKEASAFPASPEENSAVPAGLRTALGQRKAVGAFAVEAGWVSNLKAALDAAAKSPAEVLAHESCSGGLAAAAAGRGFTVAWLPLNELPQFLAATMSGSGQEGYALALATGSPGAKGNEPVRIASERAVTPEIEAFGVVFPPDSAKVPAHAIPALKRLAGLIKQLPEGRVVELRGFASRTATAKGGAELSKRRAEAVYDVLVHAGVDPRKLSPKALGNVAEAAGGSVAMEGRSMAHGRSPANDRRVEFRVVSP